jgi:hypothetical protein
MRIFISLLTVFALAGCANLLQPNYGAEMSAAQITAAGKDKSASVVCTRLIAPGYTLETVSVSLDQNAIKDGGVSGDGTKGCIAAINSSAPPRPLSPPPPPTPVTIVPAPPPPIPVTVVPR